MLPSSSGSGHRPLKAEITGSNPVGSVFYLPFFASPLGFLFVLEFFIEYKLTKISSLKIHLSLRAPKGCLGNESSACARKIKFTCRFGFIQ